MAKQKVKIALEYMMLGGGDAAGGEAAVVTSLAGGLELKNDAPRRRPFIRRPSSSVARCRL